MGDKASPLLDIAGMGLLMASAGMFLGIAAAVAAAGVCCLLVSWSLTRSRR